MAKKYEGKVSMSEVLANEAINYFVERQGKLNRKNEQKNDRIHGWLFQLFHW